MYDQTPLLRPPLTSQAILTGHRAALEHGLAGRYSLERELGAGGMAIVYLAHDLKHDRPVALKVLRPELAEALGPERFQREIRLAAGLQHPHILTVHDSGETAGQLWFTMPYVEGESLRERLEREKQLPVDDALTIAREAARALEYAHAHGVVHRDIKPENILLTADGSTLVADFGIARVLGGPTGEKLTRTGTSIGTAAYMSPEQAAGEQDVDPRSDVYSLGIVLYEMLAGETPFQAATPQAMIARRFTETPKPVSALRDSVPDTVDRAVARALARTAADRFPSARAFGDALSERSDPIATGAARPRDDGEDAGRAGSSSRAGASLRAAQPRSNRVAAAALILGLLIGGGLLFAWRERSRPDDGGAGRVTRLAVLPFENLGDSTDEYFSDGLTDEVRGKLAGLGAIQVTARSSSAEYKNTGKSPQEIGRELGVEYLLTGTVRWVKGSGESTSRVRVSPELIEVATGATDWQQSFDASLTDVFKVQADIAGRVAGALDLALGASQEQVLAVRPTASLAAYDSYLQGLAARSRGAAIGSLSEALVHFQRAVALDSNFIAAWAGVSDAASLLYGQGQVSPEIAEVARSAADRALALGPDRPEGYRVLGDYYRRVPQEPRRSLEPYRKGLELTPGDADLLRGLALAEQGIGEWERSLEHMTRSQALDPRSPLTAGTLGNTLVWLRRYPEAVAALDIALTLQPAALDAIQSKAMALIGQGDLAAARALIADPPSSIPEESYVAYMATYWDMYWVLDEASRKMMLGLSADAFDGDAASWGLALAGVYEMRGDWPRARAYADSARIALEQQLQGAPDDAQRHVLLGVALAYMGRTEEAVRAGERGTAMRPVSADATGGSYFQHQLARIHILTGNHDKALDILEALMTMPYYLSPAWLRADPSFEPLRGNPRFQRLAQGTI